MIPNEAWNILERCTQPQAMGRMNRQDYAACQEALELLKTVIEQVPVVVPAPALIPPSDVK